MAIELKTTTATLGWSMDLLFRKALEQVQDATMIDPYRLWQLWLLTKQACKADRGEFIEIGCWRGGSGCMIAAAAEASKMGHVPVHLFDTFTGVVKVHPTLDPYYKEGEHGDAAPGQAFALAQSMGFSNLDVHAKQFPEEVPATFNKKWFRFAHVDVDTYQSAKDTFNWIWPHMYDGGIVVFDDYGWPRCPGITKFVDELIAEHGLDNIIVTGQLQAVCIKTSLF